MANKKRKKRRWPLWLLGFLVLLMAGAAFAKRMGWVGKEPLTKIAVEDASLRTIIETVSASGKIYPEIEVSISPDVSGEITALLVEEGDSVEAGQLLARINPDIYASVVDRAEAAVNSARAQQANAEARIKQAEAQVAKFGSREIQADARVKQAETRIGQADTRKKQTGTRGTQVDTRIDQVKTRMKQMDTRITQVDTRIDQFNTRKKQMDTRIAQVDTRIEQFNSRKKQLDTRIGQAEARIKQLDSREQQAQARIDQFKARSKQLDMQLDNAKKTHERNEQLFKDGVIAEVELDNSLLALQGLEADKKSQTSELESLEIDFNSLEVEREVLKGDKDNLLEERAGMASELKGLEAEKAGILIEKEGMDSELAGIQSEKRGLLIEKEGMNNEIRGIEAEKTGVGVEQEGIEVEKQGLRADLESVKADRSALDMDKLGLEADVEAARKTAEGAAYNVKSSQASLKEAKDNLKRTTIYAPIDGVISSLSVEKGERVVGTTQMAGTDMMRIADFSEMEAQVDVSENDILRVSLGDTAIIEVDAYLDRKFKGVVTRIANSANSGLQASTDQITNFKVTIRILRESYAALLAENPYAFRPGMSASVDIQTVKKSNILTVPIQAVTTREIPDSLRKENAKGVAEEIEEVVFVHDGEQVYKRNIKVGIQDESHIQIVDGLKKGEAIVTAPYRAISKKLEDEMKVEVVDKDDLYKKKEDK